MIRTEAARAVHSTHDLQEIDLEAIHIAREVEVRITTEETQEEDPTIDHQADLVGGHREAQTVEAKESQVVDMEISRHRGLATGGIIQGFMVANENSRCQRYLKVMRWRSWMMRIPRTDSKSAHSQGQAKLDETVTLSSTATTLS